MKYVVVYEQTPSNWAAYVPDLPGCVAAGDTKEEVRHMIREAIASHLRVMREYGESIPEPGTWAEQIEIEVPPMSEPDETRTAENSTHGGRVHRQG